MATAATADTRAAAAAAADAAWGKLVNVNANLEPREFLLKGDEIFVGRNSKECAISFKNNKTISGKHCRFFRESGKDISSDAYFVQDLSSNGTYVNGEKLGKDNRLLLRNGDEISLVVASSDEARQKEALAKDFVAFIFQTAAAAADGGGTEGIAAVYHLGRVLGEGNFAQVREGTHKSSGEKVAVKVIDKEKFALSNLRPEALQDEVAIMRRIQHPHIICVKDVFDSPQNFYIILELVSGGDLFDRIVDRERYTEDDARKLFRHALDAIEYLHQQGIAHRDLKPENILLATRDDHTNIKISDFGLSRVMPEDKMMKTLCGTPQYLAPEVVQRRDGTTKGYTMAVDLWSLGVILYVLLAGFPPFESDDFDAILAGRYTFNYEVWNSISLEAKHLVAHLLEVDPEKRLTVAQALAHPWMAGTKLDPEEAAATKRRAPGTKAGAGKKSRTG